MNMFKIDNDLVPEAIDLYDKLHVKHEILSIIPPQFETPLPPLQLAVFDPIIKVSSDKSMKFEMDKIFTDKNEYSKKEIQKALFNNPYIDKTMIEIDMPTDVRKILYCKAIISTDIIQHCVVV